jgi:uncharacterized membrane protein
MNQWLDNLKALDDRRASIPGEHWLAFGAGVLLFVTAGRRSTGVGQVLSILAGTAMIVRATSGRDGVIQRAQRLRNSIDGERRLLR